MCAGPTRSWRVGGARRIEGAPSILDWVSAAEVNVGTPDKSFVPRHGGGQGAGEREIRCGGYDLRESLSVFERRRSIRVDDGLITYIPACRARHRR